MVYPIQKYISYLKKRVGSELDERNLGWKKQGHSLIVIDMTHERTFIVYDPAILGHWDYDEGDDYPEMVKNHFSHIVRPDKYPNVIPFRPPKNHHRTR